MRSGINSTVPRDGGAVLILALVFLLAVGLVTVAIGNMAVNANANTSNSHSQLLTQINLETEASLAIEATRDTFNYAGCASNCYSASGFSSAKMCTPTTAAISGLAVWCEGSGGSANGLPTRTVDFEVCKTVITPCAGSADVALFAEVVYMDVPAGEPQSADQCTAAFTATCGVTMSVTSWDVRLADQ